MTHTVSCTIADTGLPSQTCSECLSLNVGDLDNRGFRILMGCTREEFERWCQLPQPEGVPSGLYNFWYEIMDANAMRVLMRRQHLQRRVRA